MYNVEGYLKPIYDKPNRDIRLLEYFGAHMAIDTICSEIECLFESDTNLKDEDYFEVIFNKIYNLHTKDLPTTGSGERLKNILSVNKKQYERLKKQQFKITYPVVDHLRKYSTDGTHLYRKNLTLLPYNFPDIKTRTLVLYHRSYASDYSTDELNFGVDIFQLILIYRTLYQLIVDKKTSLFNNIQIVSRYNNLPEVVFRALASYNLPFNSSFFKRTMKMDFIQRTSIFSNTLHFFGGELPDSSLFTIPIITYAHSLQNDFMNVIKNKQVLPFFYYPGTVSVSGDLIPQEDPDYLVNGSLVTSRELKFKVDNNFTNTTIHNIINEVIKCIMSLEKKMIEDEIYE